MIKYNCLERSEHDGENYFIYGASSSGKNIIKRRLIKENKFALKEMIMSTTRPMRTGEVEGRDYYFKTEEEMLELEEQGKIIEKRKYDTVYGPWYYFTTSSNIDLENYNYIGDNTLEGLDKFVKFYGIENIISLLIKVDDGIRLQRALDREKREENPKYQELCRRFLADSIDYSEENINKRPITSIINNNSSLDNTMEEVEKVLKLNL